MKLGPTDKKIKYIKKTNILDDDILLGRVCGGVGDDVCGSMFCQSC